MIKKLLIIVSILLLLVLNARAVMVDQGDGTVTDSDTGLMWLQNTNLIFTSGYVENYTNYTQNGNVTYSRASDWASQLDDSGYDDWRLPTKAEADATVFDWSLFTNLAYYQGYWTSTQSDDGGIYYWTFLVPSSDTTLVDEDAARWVWVVRSYDAGTGQLEFVTETGAIELVGGGYLTLVNP